MFSTTNANTQNIKNQKNSEKVLLSFSAARPFMLSYDHTSSKSATEESPPSLPSARNIKGTKLAVRTGSEKG